MANVCMVLRGDIRYDGRVRKEIATLRRHGHHVDLIVSDFTGNGSGGEDLGISVHYLPMKLSSNPLRNFAEQVQFSYKAAQIAKQLRPSHIHCHNLQGLLAGVWARRATKAQIVFDAHELMPESLFGIRRTAWNLIERRSISASDYIIMPELNRIAYFEKKYAGIPKPLLLQNWPRRSDIPEGKFDVLRETFPIKRDQTIILYTGLVAPGRCIDELIDAMTMCGERFVLVVLGFAYKGYEGNLREKIERLGLTKRVFLHDPVPYTQIIVYMASCDVAIALYRNSDINNYYCAPNKVFEYIALNKPLITNDYPGLLQTVQSFEQGICLGALTPQALAEAYVRASDPSRVIGGRKKFFWEDQENVLLEIYNSSLPEGSGASSQAWSDVEKSVGSHMGGLLSDRI